MPPEPYYSDAWLTVYQGDCREVLVTLPEASVDAIVTDPPYDLTGASRNGSSRVTGTGPFGRHRIGTKGFMGKAWDGTAVAFQPETWAAMLRVAKPGAWLLTFGGTRTHHRMAVALEDAGWELTDELAWIYAQGMPKGKTTLKPAHEPILLARKPAKRVTPLQIDEVRIPGEQASGVWGSSNATVERDRMFNASPEDAHYRSEAHPDGRWPANVVLTDPVLNGHSRYFLIPKAGRRERNAGLEDVDERPMLWSSGTKSPGTFQSEGTKKEARNHHPTVKPVELMNHLVRLVCPPRGIVLDPFIGSGSTAVAAIGSGRQCLGIELDETYLPLIAKRLRLLRTEVPA